MFGQKETCRHVELPCTGRFFRKNKYIDRDKEKGSMNLENGTLFLRGKMHV